MTCWGIVCGVPGTPAATPHLASLSLVFFLARADAFICDEAPQIARKEPCSVVSALAARLTVSHGYPKRIHERASLDKGNRSLVLKITIRSATKHQVTYGLESSINVELFQSGGTHSLNILLCRPLSQHAVVRVRGTRYTLWPRH